MKTKEEVIKEAWGKNYEEFKEHIDSDGWARYPHFQKHEMIEDVRPIEFRSQRTDFRPLKLQGLENNNGWIRIESEEDLPKERMNCFVLDKTQGVICGEFINNSKEERIYWITNATHYQPIVKPKPPLY